MADLVVSELEKSYGARRVLDRLSFELSTDGRIYGVFGPNGVGKTTLFRCLLGLETCRAAQLTWRGHDLRERAPDEIARLGVTLMLQRPVALEGLTVVEHLGLILEERWGRRDQARLEELIEQHGLSHLARTSVADLSFGEAKLVDFLRVTALAPELLLLDEPFSGMDPLHVSAIQKRVRSAAVPGRAVVLTDHNLHAALPFVDYALVLYNGHLLFAGEPDEVCRHPDVRGLYLGDAL